MRVSVGVCVFNEQQALPELLRRLRAVLGSIPGGPHEIVVVDDGSKDRTAEILYLEAAKKRDITGIVLSRNFGHQAALSACLDHTSGDVVVVMDGDLQDPPEQIPLLLQKCQEGYDVVYARRIRRKEPRWLRACYYIFYRLIATLSDTRLPLDAGDFGLMSRRVVDEVRRMPEYHRYLRGLRTWVGFRQIGIPIERAERHSGEPKYSALKLLKLASDGIFSFSIVPLRFASILGAVAVFLSLCYALFALYAKLFLGRSPQGFTALIVAVSFLTGVQLFFMGVAGEYIGRIYEASKGRPVYIVSHQFGGLRKGVPSTYEYDAAVTVKPGAG